MFDDTAEGFTNLVIVDGYADEVDIERGLREDRMAEVLIDGYLEPLLVRLFGRSRVGLHVLDVGCGIGRLVDLLCERGYDAWGVDNGHRVVGWGRRIHKDRLIMAGGEAMPFPDNCFDLVFSSGVIEHIGCDGDARSPSPGYELARRKFTLDSVRVTKCGGYINYTSPNRHFPFDLFHRTQELNPFRFHWPWDPFLLSVSDFRDLFVKQCGCRRISTLPIKGYWGFNRMRQGLAGKVACKCAALWFNSFGSWPGFRSSPLNPWLSILAEK
jgi:SAM-dependent methyltransferase